MTLLCVTVTKHGATCSQDSWIYRLTADALQHAEAHGGITRDLASSYESIYLSGTKPVPVDVLGEQCKILPVPRLGIVVAGTGSFDFVLGFWMALSSAQAASFEEIKDAAPQILNALRDKIDIGNNAMVVCAGYDGRRECGYAYAYTAHDGFQRQDIAVGETMAPAPDPDDEGYPQIFELWQSANRGERVRDLHRAIYDLQLRSFLSGRLAPGVGVGGALNHAEVTGAGIQFTVS